MKKFFNKLVVFLSLMLFLCGAYVSDVSAVTWSGSGTQSSPYIINSEAALRQLATNVNSGTSYSGKYFKVTSDIALTQTWESIGTSLTAFRGIFDGNGKIISGMTVTGRYSGLFSYIGSGATIKNVTMTEFTVTGEAYIAGLVAFADAGTGTINISGCKVSGNLRDSEEKYNDGYLAGIVAYANAEKGSINISDCTSEGTYSCDYNSGGIVGYGSGNSHSLKLTNCVNKAYIYADDDANACGGIGGCISSAELTACINYGNVYGNGYSEDNGSSWLGGICGEGGGDIFRGCANYGNITTFFAGGITPSQYGNNLAIDCINAGTLNHSSDGYGREIIYSGTAINCNSVSSTALKDGSVAHSLRKYFGQKIGVDNNPVVLTDDNRVYKVTVIGEINKSYYVNYGDTVDFPKLSSCADYFNGNSKFDTSAGITRDYALAAKGYHKFTDGICSYCGSEGVNYKDVGSCGESVVWSLSESGSLNIYGTGVMKNYTQNNPAPWYEYAEDIKSVSIYGDITAVGDYSFNGLSNVSSLFISESVSIIGNYAFCGLRKLTDIAIGNSITDIGEYAFAFCSGVKYLSFGKQLKSIGAYAFYRCESVTSVTVPGTVTSIGNGAFEDCTKLNYLYLNSGTESIGSYAFSKTKIGYVYIPDTAKQIGANAFADCEVLSKIYYRGEAPEIDSTAFKNVTAYSFTPNYDSSWDDKINKNYGGTLTWAIGAGEFYELFWILDYNHTLTISGSGAMVNLSSVSDAPWYSSRNQIHSIVISDGITSIADCAFGDCINLTSVSIPDTVTKIGRTGTSYYYGRSFIGCTSLEQITIPVSVTSIAYASFLNCEKLKAINVDSGNTVYTSFDGVLYTRGMNTICCYPMGKTGSFAFSSNLREIGSYAFYGVGFTQITIPSSITDIGYGAFSNCKELKKITFEGNAPTLESYAFSNVVADVYYPVNNTTWTSSIFDNYGGTLTWHAGSGTFNSSAGWQLVYNGSVAELIVSGSGAMDDYTSDSVPWQSHLTNIRTVTVNSGITHVGASAFANATSLTKVTLADSVKTIGESAFSRCSKLSNLNLGIGIQSIGNYAFMSTAISSLSFPNSLVSVGRYSFYMCQNLKALTFGSSMKTIGYTCFANCTALQTVDLGSSVTTLEQSAFNNCSKLTKIIIPASVTTVGTYAFSQCAALQYVEFQGDAPVINSGAFTNVTCNVYYTSSKSGWTSSIMSNYAGTLTWGAISKRGKLGAYAEWILDTNGNLLICGSSSMPSYSATSNAPWYDSRSSIKKVTIRGVTSVGSYAFKDCSKITEVALSTSTSSIGTYAFVGCIGLDIVNFEGNSVSFGANCFSGVVCEMWYPSAKSWSSSVRKDYGGTLTWRAITASGYCGKDARWALDNTGTLLVVGSGAMTSYSSSTSPWNSNGSSIKEVIIGNRITSVGTYAFYNYPSIKSITIGEKVATISSAAFSKCTGVNTITFLGNAPSISSNSFNSITAIAYYPIGDTSWTSAKRQNYGGTLTWQSFCKKHNETVSPAVEPTCTTSGLTQGKYCIVCNEVFVEQEILPAYGHYVAGPDGTDIPADIVDSYCKEDIKCTVCNQIAKSAAGHRVFGTVYVEADPITITNKSSYPFTLTNGVYYSTNKSNSSSSEIRFTAKYDCTITLNYGVSSEEDYDKLKIYKNSSSQAIISGEISDQTKTLTLNAGEYVSVIYSKDSSQSDGSDCGWVEAVYGNVLVETIGDVSAETAEPDCTNAVVCRYCQTVVKEALGHRVILVSPEPENPYEVINSSQIPFVLTDGVYYSANHGSSSASEINIKVNCECTIILNYGVSSEENYDKLTISCNNTLKKTVSGVVTDQTVSFEVAAGDIITVSYSKDSSVNRNDDMGWFSVEYEYEPDVQIVSADLVEADCNGVICCFCDAVVKEPVDHIWNEGAVNVPATEESEGEMIFKCQNCDETKIESIPVLEHVHRYEIVVTEPTCEAGGYTTYTCRCDDSYTDSYTEALGHDMGQWEILNDSNCTQEGSRQRDCSRCDNYETEVIAPKGHTYNCEATSPTCTSGGYTTYTCSCGDFYVSDEVEALDHNEITHEAKAPTCTEKGWDAYVTCSRCDYTTKVEKEALGHTETEAVKENPVEVTCTVDGSHDLVVYCSVCTAELSRETNTVPATGHTEETIPAVTATCENTGLTEGAKCSVCNEVLVAQEEVKATGHNYTSFVTTAATCTTNGEKTYTCKNYASHTYTEEIAALGHDEVVHESQAATCTEKGWDEYVTCSRCDYTTYKEITEKGHSEVVDKAVAPTCTQSGLTEGSHCSVCNGVTAVQEVVNALGHLWNEGVAVEDSTCESEGHRLFECERCDETKTEAISAKGHIPSDAVRGNEIPASCTADGSYDMIVYCSICNAEIERETIKLAATGHTEVVDEAVAPTCILPGLTKGSHCSVCNEVTVAQEVVNALGHAEGEWIADKESSCFMAGLKHQVCAVCGNTINTAVIEMKPHTYKWIILQDATCGADGVKYEECSVCQVKRNENTVIEATNNHNYADATCELPKKCKVCEKIDGNPLGHNYTEATCEAPEICKICGSTNGSKLSHQSDSGTITSEATCTNEGIKTYKCKLCKVILSTETLPKLAHNYTFINTLKNATCTEKGSVEYVCSCGDSYTEETPIIHHNYHVTESVLATCESDGYALKECNDCKKRCFETLSRTEHDYDAHDICKSCNNSKVDNCSCACHKTGLYGVIWKILVFFFKMFGSIEICSCGIAHY